MKTGYREQACPTCGRRFPVLARAPARWCSWACAKAVTAAEWRTRAAQMARTASERAWEGHGA